MKSCRIRTRRQGMISLVMRGWIPRRVADTEADMAPEDLISVISVISSKAFLAADSAIPEEVIPMLRVRDEMYKRQSPLTFLKHAKELKSRFRYSEWRTAVSVQAPDRLRAAARKREQQRRGAENDGKDLFHGWYSFSFCQWLLFFDISMRPARSRRRDTAPGCAAGKL